MIELAKSIRLDQGKKVFGFLKKRYIIWLLMTFVS